VNRQELRQLCDDRVLDADALLKTGRWSAAYYLAGYAVEVAIKSCILTHLEATEMGIIFEDKRFSEKCWTHDLGKLVEYAGLEDSFQQEMILNLSFGKHWLLVKDWKEISRYEQRTQAEAEGLYNAITHPSDGVLPWIKKHW
jgi:HEPN domain-containing protein